MTAHSPEMVGCASKLACYAQPAARHDRGGVLGGSLGASLLFFGGLGLLVDREITEREDRRRPPPLEGLRLAVGNADCSRMNLRRGANPNRDVLADAFLVRCSQVLGAMQAGGTMTRATGDVGP